MLCLAPATHESKKIGIAGHIGITIEIQGRRCSNSWREFERQFETPTELSLDPFSPTSKVMNMKANKYYPRNSARIAVNRRGSVLPLFVLSIVLLALLGGGVWWAFGNRSKESAIQPILSEVFEGEFVAKVLDQGEIQSAENQEIVCQVGSRAGTIEVIDVIDEGTQVKEGDWLVTLDKQGFEKELEQQRIAATNAETAVIQAQAAYDAAVATLKEYKQGIFVEQERMITNDLLNAKQELEQAEAYLAHSVKLQKKGYMTKQQLRSDEIQVSKAENSVALAEQQLKVLVEITAPKEISLLESDIKAAKVKWDNDLEAQKIELEQLAEIEEQLENCEIYVPQGVSGEVVFAKEFDRRGGAEWVLEPGAQVRERQVLIRLPNRDKMEVKVLVNEQSITLIETGMPAVINVDALNKQKLRGYVTKVNQYAEQGGWMSSSAVREYAVFVRIVDPPRTIIPGMNASVSIQTMYQKSVAQAPIQCIYAVNDELFVLRRNGPNDYETVQVTVGGENSQNVWITSGIEVGDLLVMNPGAYKEMMDLPRLRVRNESKFPKGPG